MRSLSCQTAVHSRHVAQQWKRLCQLREGCFRYTDVKYLDVYLTVLYYAFAWIETNKCPRLQAKRFSEEERGD